MIVESVGTRLREVRHGAARTGMFVRKTRNDPNLRRYIFVERDGHIIRRSNNFEFPYSFSLAKRFEFLAKSTAAWLND
jgi:hypothetical protein